MADDAQAGAAVAAQGDSATSTTDAGAESTGKLTPDAGGATAAEQARKFAYDEDRSQWVPPHRVREYAQALRQAKAEIESERRRVAALAGVEHRPEPARPYTAEEAAVRDQLKYLLREDLESRNAGGIDDEDRKFLREMREAGFAPSEIKASLQHYWESHGRSTLNALDQRLEKEIGSLTPAARRIAQVAFADFIESDPERQGRYEVQDGSVLEDFYKELDAGFLKPVRDKAQTAAAKRAATIARLPRGGGSAPPAPGKTPLKPGDLDKSFRTAWAQLQAESGE